MEFAASEAGRQTRWGLWLRWVGANGLAELIGLGGSALVGIAIARVAMDTLGGALLTALALVLAGTLLEGLFVGAAQWLVLREALPNLPARHWIVATAVGAGVAWTLGMIPATAASLTGTAATAGSDAVPEMSGMMVYGMAALMGVMLGPILGFPQAWILHRYVDHAGWWVPANAVAWAAGMVIVFFAAGSVPAGVMGLGTFLYVGIMLGLAGLVVGAIHGLALLWLLQFPTFPETP